MDREEVEQAKRDAAEVVEAADDATQKGRWTGGFLAVILILIAIGVAVVGYVIANQVNTRSRITTLERPGAACQTDAACDALLLKLSRRCAKHPNLCVLAQSGGSKRKPGDLVIVPFARPGAIPSGSSGSTPNVPSGSRGGGPTAGTNPPANPSRPRPSGGSGPGSPSPSPAPSPSPGNPPRPDIVGDTARQVENTINDAVCRLGVACP